MKDLLGNILNSIIIGVFITAATYLILKASDNDENRRKSAYEAYQKQLSTYIQCIKKSEDKSICGAIPDIKNYRYW